jgi:hydrogenase nickel incorporation protein HypB
VVCTTCGCGSEGHDHDDDVAVRTLKVEQDLLEKNAMRAERTRRRAGRDRIAIFNLIGSPGAGKTSLLAALIPRMRGVAPVSVVGGDQATERDARRVEEAGCKAFQINTGTVCHLDAPSVERGIAALSPPRGSVVFIENVGNLVCPALFDLGENAKIVVMAVTEGEDKPLKYPHAFRAARLVVLTKIDLLPYVAFDEDACVAYAREVSGPKLEVLRVSAMGGQGVDELVRWLKNEIARAPSAPTAQVSS